MPLNLGGIFLIRFVCNFSNIPKRLKDYYQILRVSRQANVLEIKRAYRRLAVVFHPDKNPSEEASALFQEINEAHEVLSDPDKRGTYDFMLRGGSNVSTPQPAPAGTQWHRDPAYRRRQQQPGYRRPVPRPPEHLLMMAHFLKYLPILCFIGIGWCAILIFDLLLPFRVLEEKALSESARIYGWKTDHVPYIVVTDNAHQFPVTQEGVDFFPVGSTVRIFASRIMNVLVKVESGDRRFTIYALDSVYQNFLPVPIILLIFSVFGLTLKSGIEFRFSFGIALCMVILINLVFLIFSIL